MDTKQTDSDKSKDKTKSTIYNPIITLVAVPNKLFFAPYSPNYNSIQPVDQFKK